jgi:predicted HAD superfamily Cof-like phosphohydrolase
MFRSVIEFNRLIGNHGKPEPQLPSEAEAKWIHEALNEEADEFLEACEIEPNLVGAVDALIDSIYFAIGGLHRLGLTEEQMQKCFDAVHNANLTKKGGLNPNRTNDGTVADATKPEGWVGPEQKIREILNVSWG